MSPDGVDGASGVFGNGLTSSSVRGWVDSRSAETPRKLEKGDAQLAPLEAISSLETLLL